MKISKPKINKSTSYNSDTQKSIIKKKTIKVVKADNEAVKKAIERMMKVHAKMLDELK